MNKTAGNSCLRYGLSLPCTTAAELEAFGNIPECFDLLELRGELIRDVLQLKKSVAWLQEFESLNFRDLIDSTLTCQLSNENRSIVQEYKKQLRELFALAAQCKAEFAGIDPDWEQLLADPERLEVFNDVLRSTAGDREYNKLDLVIAVRLPGSGQHQVTEAVALLHKLSNYRVKLALDINPHELLGSTVDWASLLDEFRFNTAAVRFCYHSELGNKLLYKHIEPMVKVLAKFQYPTAISIAPSGRADLEELAALIDTINQEA